MNSNNTNRSTSQLQSDVRAEINQIKQSLDNIRNRASPGQLIDDAIFYPHDANPARTFDHLKSNPVGTTFLAVGTILLMEDGQHRTVENRVGLKVGEARTRVSEAVVGVKESLHHVADSARSRVNTVKGKVSDKVDTMTSRVSGTSDIDPSGANLGSMNDSLSDSRSRFDDVSQLAGEMTGSLKDSIRETGDSISERASEIKSTVETSTHNLAGRVKESIGTSIDSARDSVRNMDPITYIALGAGLGALSGAALPVSGAEQRLVDSKLGDGLEAFRTELQAAFHQSFDVMKTEFVSGLTDFDFGKLKESFSSSARA